VVRLVVCHFPLLMTQSISAEPLSRLYSV
jgi:hypothetical protein